MFRNNQNLEQRLAHPEEMRFQYAGIPEVTKNYLQYYYQNKTNLFPWDALIKWNQYERKYNGSNYQDGNSQVLESYIDGSDLLDTLPDSIEDDSYKFLTKSKGTLMLHLLLTMKPNSKEKNEEFIDRLEKTAQQVIETAIINGETDVVETLKLLADYMNVPPYKC